MAKKRAKPPDYEQTPQADKGKGAHHRRITRERAAALAKKRKKK